MRGRTPASPPPFPLPAAPAPGCGVVALPPGGHTECRPRGERCPREGVRARSERGRHSAPPPPRKLRCAAVSGGGRMLRAGPGRAGGVAASRASPRGSEAGEKDGGRRKRPRPPAYQSTQRDGRVEPPADGSGSRTAPAVAARRSALEGSGAEGWRGPAATKSLRAAGLLRARHGERCVPVVFQPCARSQKRGDERSKVHQQKNFKDYLKAGEGKKKQKQPNIKIKEGEIHFKKTILVSLFPVHQRSGEQKETRLCHLMSSTEHCAVPHAAGTPSTKRHQRGEGGNLDAHGSGLPLNLGDYLKSTITTIITEAWHGHEEDWCCTPTATRSDGDADLVLGCHTRSCNKGLEEALLVAMNSTALGF